MPDCRDARMRDALPDLMHGTLPPQRLAEARAHVEACDACRAELDLLERVRSSVRSPAVGVEAIVSSLPRYARRAGWRRVAAPYALRVAAAVLLVAGAAFLFRSDMSSSRTNVVDTAVPRASAPVELAVGETFADVSDSALVSLVDAMADLDAVVSEEPESVTLPLLSGEGL